MIAMDNYLTTDEIAEKLRVSRNTIIKLVASGKIPATRVGRQYRVTEKDFLEYVNSNNTAQKEEDKPEQK